MMQLGFSLHVAAQSIEEVAQAVAQLKHLQENHYEDDEKAAEPLQVPAEIVQLAEYRKRRTSDRPGVHLPTCTRLRQNVAMKIVIRETPKLGNSGIK